MIAIRWAFEKKHYEIVRVLLEDHRVQQRITELPTMIAPVLCSLSNGNDNGTNNINQASLYIHS
jgi:hypothetical protein